MITSSAHIPTTEAQSLIRGLCTNWSKSFPVTHEDQWGEIQLPIGICCLYAGNELKVVLESDPEQMPVLQQMVTDHLQCMATSNEKDLVIHWE